MNPTARLPSDNSHTNANMSKFAPWLISFCAALFFFYEILQLTIFNAIGPAIMDTFQLNPGELGQLSSTYLYSCALALLPAGLLYDRLSTKKVMVFAASLCVIGVACGASFHLVLAYCGRVLTGLGNAFAFLGCMQLATCLFPAKRIAVAIGLTITIAMLGGVAAQRPVNDLLHFLTWQEMMRVNLIIGVSIVLAMFIVIPDPEKPKLATNPISLKSFKESVLSAISSRQNWLCGLYVCIANLPIMLFGALFGNLYLVEVHKMSSHSAANITSLLFIGLIVGSPLLPWISEKFHNKKSLMLICSAIMTVTLLGSMYYADIHVLMSLFFLMGVCSSAQVLIYPIVSQSNPMHYASTALGFTAVIMNMGAASMQILFGSLLNKNHPLPFLNLAHIAGDFSTPLFILFIVFALNCAIAYLIKQKN